MKLLLAIVLTLLMLFNINGQNDLTPKLHGRSWSPEDIDDGDEFKDVSQIIQQKRFDFTGTLRGSFALTAALEKPERSLVCSPISALLPLGKLVLGSERGQTRNELLNAIGATQHQVKSRFRKLVNKLSYLPGVALMVASRIFYHSYKRLNKNFMKQTQSVFKSTCDHVNFDSPRMAADHINKWVYDQTRGMISDLINPNQISGKTSLIIVNAVYFAGLWLEPFRKLFVGKFNSPQGVRQIPMMSRVSMYSYVRSSSLGAEILQIPYFGNSSSFVIVLPEDDDGLTLLLRKLKVAPGLLNTAMEGMRTTHLSITIPKFKIESEVNLKDLYHKMGLKSIFDAKKSGLSRIIVDETVHVTAAVHKCIIEIHEQGTQASAASAMEFLPVSLPHSVVVDRPFLFYVKVHTEQLFAGIYTGEV